MKIDFYVQFSLTPIIELPYSSFLITIKILNMVLLKIQDFNNFQLELKYISYRSKN